VSRKSERKAILGPSDGSEEKSRYGVMEGCHVKGPSGNSISHPDNSSRDPVGGKKRQEFLNPPLFSIESVSLKVPSEF
jgi:hypothetical protein